MDSDAVGLLLKGAALGLSSAAAPGPLQALLVSETLLGGFRRGARVAPAPLLTDAPIVALVLVVLGQMPAAVLRVLGIGGGLYLLWLAWRMAGQWRASGEAGVEEAAAHSPGWQGLRRATVINLLNPNPYVFWVFVGGPILVAALERSLPNALVFLSGFYGVLVGAMMAIALVFDQARRLGPRVVHGLLLASIVVMVAFGLLLLGQGLGAGV